MFKRLFHIAVMVAGLGLAATSAYARGQFFGYAQKGGNSTVTSGSVSSNKVQVSYPGSLVTVYLTGTTTKATLYSNSGGTALGNPVTVGTDGSFSFWTDTAVFDLTFSGKGITTQCGNSYPGYPCIPAFTWPGMTWNSSAGSVSAPIVYVRSYNAAGDGKTVTDGSMAAGSAILLSASGRFLSTDVGKTIRVEGAGAGGVALSTTILSYQGTTQVTLNATNASGAPIAGKTVLWGTNDTAAIQAAVDALKIGVANTGNGTLIFGNDPGVNAIYLITDTINFGAAFNGSTITSNGWPYVNGDITGGGVAYAQTELRWAGADGTGKPIFWFKEASTANIVSHLGFYGGAEAIRFRVSAGGQSESFNKVRECIFDAQTVASIMIGFDLSDLVTDADMGQYFIEYCQFVYPKVGIVANVSTNGYGLTIRGCHFLNSDTTYAPSGAQPVRLGNFNNVVFEDIIFTVSSVTFNGQYPVEKIGAGATGYYKFSRIYAEVPLLFKGTMAGWQAHEAIFSDVSINTTLTDAKAAIDVTGFADLTNAPVSSGHTGVATQRTINATEGGIARGKPANTNLAPGYVYDLYTGGPWIFIGPVSGNTLHAINIPNAQYLGSFDTPGGNRRRLIGMDASGNVRVASDGNIIVLDGNSVVTSAPVAGVATLATGCAGPTSCITVSSTAVTANSTILFSRKTPAGTLCPTLAVTASVPATSFTISASPNCNTETSTVSWLILN